MDGYILINYSFNHGKTKSFVNDNTPGQKDKKGEITCNNDIMHCMLEML